MGVLALAFLVSIASYLSAHCSLASAQLDVTNFGALGDGRHDDSPAFLKAWKSLCQSSEQSPALIVPEGKTFLLQPLAFSGPCKSRDVRIQIDGVIIAPTRKKFNPSCPNHWIRFSTVDNLAIDGKGKLDGQGATWWKEISQVNEMLPQSDKFESIVSNKGGCTPTGIYFYKCPNLRLTGIKSINPPHNHIGITKCNGAVISNLYIEAPDDSPNTDGIDISSTSNMTIRNCFIGTGDDCIAIKDGAKFLTIRNVTCGPGHGISVGSLGRNGNNETVEDVIVQDCTFTRVQNGARIKTAKGGSGWVRRISFINLIMVDAKRPIIIDQRYCPHNECPQPANASSTLEISDISFINIHGTSGTLEAITLNCSDFGPGCTNTLLKNVTLTKAKSSKLFGEDDRSDTDHLTYARGNSDLERETTSKLLDAKDATENEDGDVYARCNNVHGRAIFTTPRVPCLE